MKKKLKKQQKQKKQRLIQNVSIVAGGLIVALALHFFVLADSNIGSKLKTNIGESNQANNQLQQADLYLEKINDDYVMLKSSKQISNITGLSLSLNYNPEKLEIIQVSPLNSKTKILSLANIPGINTVILEWGKPENISAGGNIIEIKTNKKIDSLAELNILVDTIEFSDSDNNSYSPTTSGIRF